MMSGFFTEVIVEVQKAKANLQTFYSKIFSAARTGCGSPEQRLGSVVRLDQGGEVATVSCREGWVMEDAEAMKDTETQEVQEVTLHCDAGRWVGQGRACRGGLVMMVDICRGWTHCIATTSLQHIITSYHYNITPSHSTLYSNECERE